MTLGQRIKTARKAAKLTQAQLAAACGWDSPSRVGNYEQDAREPTLDDLSLIAAAVAAGGHSLEWIVTGNEKAVLLGGKAEVSADVAKVLVPAFTIRGVDGHDGIDPEKDVMIPVLDVECGGYTERRTSATPGRPTLRGLYRATDQCHARQAYPAGAIQKGRTSLTPLGLTPAPVSAPMLSRHLRRTRRRQSRRAAGR